MRSLRACVALIGLSFRRLVWSANSLMLLFPVLGCGLFVWGMKYQRVKLPDEALRRFSEEFVVGLFASFLLPIIALAYATTSLGGDREDRTLLFLLIRPVPRALILMSKFIATLPLVLGLTAGSFYVYCRLAGPAGAEAFHLYLPVSLYMALAYTSLFHLFAVWFRHSTILALVYALFIEVFLGNLPGIIKRVAINFYGRSMMIELGRLSPPATWLTPLKYDTAVSMLLGITIVSMLLALVSFQWREYHDLT